MSRAEVCKKYEGYIKEKIKSNPEYHNLNELRSKKIGCWCKPEQCHGDIYY